MGDNAPVIRRFTHKGLERFYRTGSKAGIQLKGARKGIWAVKVSGNWRVTFHFADGDADIVHYEVYH